MSDSQEAKRKEDEREEIDLKEETQKILLKQKSSLFSIGLTIIFGVYSIMFFVYGDSYHRVLNYIRFFKYKELSTFEINESGLQVSECLKNGDLQVVYPSDMLVVLTTILIMFIAIGLFIYTKHDEKIEDYKDIIKLSKIREIEREKDARVMGNTLLYQVTKAVNLSHEHLLKMLCESVVDEHSGVVACSAYDYLEAKNSNDVTFIVNNLAHYALYNTRSNVISKEIYKFNSHDHEKFEVLLERAKAINVRIYSEIRTYLIENFGDEKVTDILVKEVANNRSKRESIISEGLKIDRNTFKFDALDFIEILFNRIDEKYKKSIVELKTHFSGSNLIEDDDSIIEVCKYLLNIYNVIVSINEFGADKYIEKQYIGNLNEQNVQFNKLKNEISQFYKTISEEEFINKYKFSIFTEILMLNESCSNIDNFLNASYKEVNEDDSKSSFIKNMLGRKRQEPISMDKIDDKIEVNKDRELIQLYEMCRDIIDTTTVANTEMSTLRAMLNAMVATTFDEVTPNGLTSALDWELRKLQRSGVMTSILIKDLHYCNHEGKSDKNGRFYLFFPVNINYKQVIFTVSLDYLVIAGDEADTPYREYLARIVKNISEQFEFIANQYNAKFELGYKEF